MEIDDYFLQQEPEPEPPDGESSVAAGLYILDLREYSADCSAKLKAIATLKRTR